MVMVDDVNDLLNKLNGMNTEDSLPSWLSDKITLSQNYISKAKDYLLNPVESVNEAKNWGDTTINYKKDTPRSLKKSNFKTLDILVPKGRVSFVVNTLKKEVPRIKISHEEVDSYTKDGVIVSNFKKDDINKIMAIADHAGSLFESINEGGVEKVLKMANDQSFGKLGGRTVDGLSAGLFKAVYDKANDKNKEKINKMNEKQLYVFMTKLWSKFGNQVRIS